jgi:hypothetical protein
VTASLARHYCSAEFVELQVSIAISRPRFQNTRRLSMILIPAEPLARPVLVRGLLDLCGDEALQLGLLSRLSHPNLICQDQDAKIFRALWPVSKVRCR